MGFAEASRQAGITSVWASEIDKNCVQVAQRHFPHVRQLGDITTVNGTEIEPVDIITFGSPCQDLSVAGKRQGLEGERSSLFYEATRIIYEMREVTNGRYPRFAVWENVPGALSSNKGEDFRAVISELVGSEVPLPRSGRWTKAGMVRGGGGRSVAWRVIDAQFFGTPQRRRRIIAVVDFGGDCAAEILFERQGVSGDSEASEEARQDASRSATEGS